MFVVSSCNNKTPVNNPGDSTATENADSVSFIPDAKNFQSAIDGKQTGLYILKNGDMQLAVTNYGARIVSLIVPGKNGKATDVSVGYDNLAGYTKGNDTYFGAIVGRYGNRIAKGKFKLDGKVYSLAINNGVNSLHGGDTGFSRKVWDAQQMNDSVLQLTYISKDGEEGYPGTLTSTVTYTVLSHNRLKIDYEASTDKNTVLNLTNHCYFNLNGQGSGSILNHALMINAGNYTPVDSTLIPTGKIETVTATPLDFTKTEIIGERINDSAFIQLKYGHGYDFNFVLNTKGDLQQKAAEVTGDISGIVMDIYTEQPGLQFYSGNFMDGSHILKQGKRDNYRTAFCLETQHFPNSPNQPGFPSTELNSGEHFHSTTIYAFGLKKQ